MRISDWSSDVCSSDLSRRRIDAVDGALAPWIDLHGVDEPAARWFLRRGAIGGTDAQLGWRWRHLTAMNDPRCRRNGRWRSCRDRCWRRAWHGDGGTRSRFGLVEGGHAAGTKRCRMDYFVPCVTFWCDWMG